MQPAEGRRQRDLQDAARPFAVDRGEVLGILDGGQHGDDALEEALPDLGRGEAPGGPLQ